jgi:hypothetical protein
VRPHGRPGTLVVAGRAAWLRPYLADTFFLSAPASEPLATTTIWGLPGALRGLAREADATLALLDSINARWSLARDHLRLPTWVDLGRSATASRAEIFRRNESARSDLRHIHRAGLKARLSRDPADLDRYYGDYYVPTTLKRYGQHAFVHSAHFLRDRYRNGFLLWIEKDREPIAGCLGEVRAGFVKMWSVGLRGGDQQWAKLGAYGAVYYFLGQQAHDLGAHAVGFGGCRPFLSDGVLRYKRKWGATLAGRAAMSYDDLCLGWTHFNPVVADLLDALSVVFLERGRLAALTCLAAAGPAAARDAERRRHLMWTPGLGRLYIVGGRGWEANSTAPPDCELLRPEDVGSSAVWCARLRG